MPRKSKIPEHVISLIASTLIAKPDIAEQLQANLTNYNEGEVRRIIGEILEDAGIPPEKDEELVNDLVAEFESLKNPDLSELSKGYFKGKDVEPAVI
ncbi:MAG: hypothetical protein JSV42_08500 [Chloroflexota bacterium]|nr:MAG: hypothetical protein JSV42_08500 [Chloroflexota bacterium]